MDGRAPTRKFRICVHCARLDRGDECTPAEFAVALTYPKASSPGDTETVRTEAVASVADPVWNKKLEMSVTHTLYAPQTVHTLTPNAFPLTAPRVLARRSSPPPCSRSS